MSERKTIGDAFGGQITTLEEQRRIWLDALHEDAIWEGPTFETPIWVIGREATGRFMELLLRVVPRFSTTLVAAYPTSDPDTVIIEAHGGGPTVDGGRYAQRYFSLITSKNGQAGGDEIMTKYNKPWPASQPRDPITLPPVK